MCHQYLSRQAYLSAKDVAVSQEVADGKVSIQSACALNTWYLSISLWSYFSIVTELFDFQ
jgi:hypothetical protein